MIFDIRTSSRFFCFRLSDFARYSICIVGNNIAKFARVVGLFLLTFIIDSIVRLAFCGLRDCFYRFFSAPLGLALHASCHDLFHSCWTKSIHCVAYFMTARTCKRQQSLKIFLVTC